MKVKNGHGRAPNTILISTVQKEHDYQLDFLASLSRFEEKRDV